MNRNHDNAPALEVIELKTAERPSCGIVWLHGLGADGHDFVPIAEAMPRLAARGVHYRFPHAPYRPVTINNGMVMRAWYDITGMELQRGQDGAGIAAACAALRALLAADRTLPVCRLFLAGFSQGGVIALATGLGLETPPAGIVALSCYLPAAGLPDPWPQPAARRVPVFMAHGRHDPLIPPALGEAGRRTLQAAGIAVDWHTYPMQHQVCAAEIADLETWLLARLAQLDGGETA